jgi:hypothetical protein
LNLPAKLLGLLLLGGGFLSYFRLRRALTRGYIGSGRDRVYYHLSPWRFKLALVSYVVGVLICVGAAALCLSHGFHH